MSKLFEYVGVFHALKDRMKETWTQWWHSDSSPSSPQQTQIDTTCKEKFNVRTRVKEKLETLTKETIRRINGSSTNDDDFSHLTSHPTDNSPTETRKAISAVSAALLQQKIGTRLRSESSAAKVHQSFSPRLKRNLFAPSWKPKSRRELLKVSAAVMGIEFSYAAETAFVSPLLLNLGLRHRHMTLMWCLSPIVGFFVTPILGSLSDGCRSQMGRRRPFIILLSVGIVLGLILVPNGQWLGRLLGDKYKADTVESFNSSFSSLRLPSPSVFNATDEFRQNDEDHGNSNSYSTVSVLPLLQRDLGRNGDETIQSSETDGRKPMESIDQIVSYKESRHTRLMDRNAANNVLTNDETKDNKDFLTKSLTQDKELDLSGSMLQKLVVQARVDNQELTSEENEKVDEDVETQSTTESKSENEVSLMNHPWALIFTVIGTVLLDFDADACQSPSRAYMLDVTIPEDHAKGLSTFTIMAGLGGAFGYLLGALNWENTFLGSFFGGQVRAVFTLVLFIFIGCVITTIRSFREIPIDRLWPSKRCATAGLSNSKRSGSNGGSYCRFEDEPVAEECCSTENTAKNYGTIAVGETSFIDYSSAPTQNEELSGSGGAEKIPTFREYVKTIVRLPKSLQWLCLTNFFCWMSLVCYSLYFTDFVGEAVFGGNPTGSRVFVLSLLFIVASLDMIHTKCTPLGSPLRSTYESGVRFGCWGMALYSLSCSIYSLAIDRLISRFGAKRVYICGQLGMVGMAIARHPVAVIILSWTAGIMYATLFTMPYLLVARYHASDTFDVDCDDLVGRPNEQIRGLGTDVAIVSSMVFLAQMTQAVTIGSVVAAAGTTTAVVCAASVFAFCGAISATKVLYLDL